MERSFGAMAPPDCEWQMGKTAATISFVRDAELVFDSCTESQQKQLFKLIQDLKSGEMVFEDWQSVEDFLQTV